MPLVLLEALDESPQIELRSAPQIALPLLPDVRVESLLLPHMFSLLGLCTNCFWRYTTGGTSSATGTGTGARVCASLSVQE